VRLIGLRLGNDIAADDAGSAGAVVDDDLLPEAFGKFLRGEPRHDVVGTGAGGKWHHHPDRPVWIGLRVSTDRRKQQRRDNAWNEEQAWNFHCGPP